VSIGVSDFRSNPREQIAHAAEVLGKSEHRRKVFVAIYEGKKRVKTVSELEKRCGLPRLRVLQEAGVLGGNDIVHKTKIGKELAYEKDEFYSHNKEKVLRLAGNREALDRFPTKFNPRREISIRISLPRDMVKVEEVTIDDLDSFERVRRIRSNADEVPIEEKQFKAGLKKIIGEKGVFQDWGGESNDLLSTRVIFRAKRISTAFGLKGKGTTGTLVPKKMGKRGDQLQKLLAAPAQMFIVQYWGQIDESITDQMRRLATAKSWSEGRPIYIGIIDGQDTQRLIVAYKDEKQFEDLKNRLDLILRLLALDKLSGKKVVDQVSVLTEFGFRPSEIAMVLNRKGKDITSIQAKMKKSGEAK
jgi:hypothetical protein